MFLVEDFLQLKILDVVRVKSRFRHNFPGKAFADFIRKHFYDQVSYALSGVNCTDPRLVSGTLYVNLHKGVLNITIP